MAVQAACLIIVKRVVRKRSLSIPNILWMLPSGVVFGVVFDLVVGSSFGVFNYHLGYGLAFLTLNGAVSYTLMMATVTLLRDEPFFKFYAWIAILGALYEIANGLFPVWIWEFADNVLIQESVLIFAAYFGLATCMAITLRLIYGTRFRFLGSY